MIRKISIPVILGLSILLVGPGSAGPAAGGGLTQADPPTRPVTADAVQVAEIIELPLLAAPGPTSAYLAPDGERIAYLSGETLCILEIDTVAADVQAAVDAGTPFENALDGLTGNPDQFAGVTCTSLAALKSLDQETIRWSPDGRYLAMAENFFKSYNALLRQQVIVLKRQLALSGSDKLSTPVFSLG